MYAVRSRPTELYSQIEISNELNQPILKAAHDEISDSINLISLSLGIFVLQLVFYG